MVSLNTIRTVLNMKDSKRKLIKLNELMLKVEYLSPLWMKLNIESRRLQENGYTFERI